MDAIKASLKFDTQIFLLQVVLFIVLVVVMNALFWKPFLSHLKGRQQSIADAYKQVETTRHEMERLRAEYQARITQIEADARLRIQTAVKEAQTERERLLTEARTEAEASLKQGVATIEHEKVEALQNLRERIVGLAIAAVGKALGPTSDPITLRRMVEERITSNSQQA